MTTQTAIDRFVAKASLIRVTDGHHALDYSAKGHPLYWIARSRWVHSRTPSRPATMYPGRDTVTVFGKPFTYGFLAGYDGCRPRNSHPCPVWYGRYLSGHAIGKACRAAFRPHHGITSVAS